VLPFVLQIKTSQPFTITHAVAKDCETNVLSFMLFLARG
jgi:hypothetical protein